MKVLAVLGSGRSRGNSSKAMAAAIDGMAHNSPTLEMVELGKLKNIHPCRGCDGCRRNKRYECVNKDELLAIIHEAREADTILISAPIYFFGFNSLTKLFMERTFYSSEGYDGGPSLLSRKRFGLILTYGGADLDDSGARNAIGTFRDMSRYVGFQVEGIVHGTASEKDGPSETMLEECRELGRRLSANVDSAT